MPYQRKFPARKPYARKSKSYTKRKSVPPSQRYAINRTRVAANIAVKKAMLNVSESKVIDGTQQDEVLPNPIQLGAVAYVNAFCLQNAPSAWTGGGTTWNNLNGYTIPQGDSRNQRTGSYMFLRKTTLMMHIDANNNSPQPMSRLADITYRVIVGKSNRKYNPGGITPNCCRELFLDANGFSIGHETPGTNGTDLLMLPLNKKKFYISYDKCFTLGPDGKDTDGVQSSGHYPSRKFMRLSLPINRKVHFQDPESVPDTWDGDYFVLIYASSNGKDSVASPWEVSMRMSTSALDN